MKTKAKLVVILSARLPKCSAGGLGHERSTEVVIRLGNIPKATVGRVTKMDTTHLNYSGFADTLPSFSGSPVSYGFKGQLKL